MKYSIHLTLIILAFHSLSSEGTLSKLCNSFSDCTAKALKTDIYRKKISFYEEALRIFKKSDGDLARSKVLLLKANATVREALGDTGYKGEIALKVTHKPEYKSAQLKKATADLDEAEKQLEELGEGERTLFAELREMIKSN
ncbi:hypothetical protein EHQ58_04225 [Leptospira ognonensis]|uniref:Uncharacterized protein n=1 Tax=Leptospira ognonensis TaxID=2484945 RepID=A0A4R9K828_9LEPT|nr:hypothetical protein [Leptospira ognonensis]TGL61827.1 hypothetical protein EHQ58_04225 [Leptospira ognonensis]